MIVPDHWAESRRQHRHAGKQITVRRFGWSSTDMADAQAMADARADEALQRLVAGERLPLRERKMPYNGADGVPIREEVLARHGAQVISRNAYGAHCLNSPNALFADIDFDTQPRGRTVLLCFAMLAVVSMSAALVWSLPTAILSLILSAVFAGSVARLLFRLGMALRGGPQHMARQRLQQFVAAHPAWNLRLYQTPAGLRVLATHQPFDPRAEEVAQFFAAARVDPLYAQMCINQHCFRARLTAKPWRIGIAAHMRPRPGVWPVAAEKTAMRNAWIAEYEAASADYAACRYTESLGSGLVHPALHAVMELHDKASRALVSGARIA